MPDPRLAQADALLRARQPLAAKAILDGVLAGTGPGRGDRRIALLLRSRAFEDQRQLPPAIADLRAALALEPRDPKAYNTLGILLADSGDADGAVGAFRQATALDPKYVRGWNNLANALRTQGRAAEALAAAQRAVALQPDYAQAWGTLGVVQRDLGQETEAEASLRRALALKPDYVPALTALAAIARADARLDDAVALYTRIGELSPLDGLALLQLGGSLAEIDEVDAARQAYVRARTANPRFLRAAFGEALTLPMVYTGAADAAAARATYAAGLERLRGEVGALVAGRSFGDVVDDLRWSNFLLAYQGEDDRELQQAYARVVGAAIDAVAPGERAPLPRRANRGGRLRIGFASSFFSVGTVGMYFRSWVEGLDPERFEVHLYHLRRGTNELADDLARHTAHFRSFAGPAALPSRVAPAIRADALDVLVYPELGMDATTFALAALRLAPVQCAAWGHPVTSGHPTIDAWFSCAAMEPDGAQAHYAEPLVTLPGIGTCYARPKRPPPASRAELGLPDGVPLFVCPQSLFKIHPDNDALLARALAASPGARLVLFEGRHPRLTAKFRARFAAALAEVGLDFGRQVIVLPACAHPRYLQVNATCDAMLDTLRWSGGNTSLDALACGLPIVTQRGTFMRGRQSAAMLGLMGLDELIAADADAYVALAARLAGDTDWRTDLGRRIVAAQPAVFDDAGPLAALERALVALAEG